jgi:outer membrane lipoprotein-sorting protein
MKTSIKSLLFALSLSAVTSFAAFADVKPERPAQVAAFKSSVFPTIDGKLRISLDKETGGPVDIRLKNEDGAVVYNHHLDKKDTQYRSRLNLSELPDGTYQVEITNGTETSTQSITISTKKPTTPTRLVALN